MTKIRCAALIAAVGVGLAAGGCGPTLSCGNPLDGSIYGFNLVIPDDFNCAGSLPGMGSLLAIVGYSNGTADTATRSILVAVAPGQTGTGDITSQDTEGVVFSTEAEYESKHGLTFTYVKGTSTSNENTTVTYVGAIDLPGGENALGITLLATEDSDGLLDDFKEILDGLTFTS